MQSKELKTQIPLAFQHVFAMFGATVLVPFITGLNPSVALFTAGLGTLLFHLVTGGKVPAFLGSSFAFIAGINAVSSQFGMAHATGGIIAVGVVYILMAGIVALVGVSNIKRLFPPIVTGPIIIVIGLILAPEAIAMASEHWGVALITICAVIFTGILGQGFLKLIPLIIGIATGYIFSVIFGIADFTTIREAAWLSAPDFMAPQFSADALKIMIPITLVTVVEHIGDITTNGAVVGQDFFKKPGLHRTLLGDGIATIVGGAFGGPANTTYGENTGVLALTKNYNPAIIRMAAGIAIIFSFIGKLGAFIMSIPEAVMGGISFVLFGMIASVGIRTLVDNAPDLSDLKNSSVVFVILIVGISYVQGEDNLAVIHITEYATLEGLSLAALLGISLNAFYQFILPLFVRKSVRSSEASYSSSKTNTEVKPSNS
ncbi:uracil-xanthine permease family protein [Natranaerobius trueperi]|uniref:Uracil permease n=1 Tax=Natranaerobius trueperi TaxID=759412 RepID=A0A226BX72_9FIRM|nr:solute carrier family 23 protein [Natranaerobius trueperi]OWZ82924.1 uracil permease [Natranaerobius trueperi]